MDEHCERPLHELVIDDKFYQEVQARLKDTNETDSEGKTLLHLAARSLEDNSKTIKLLLDKGTDVNSATTTSGFTPLHFAVGSRKRYAVAALIEAGASVNSRDNMGRTPLHRAFMRRLPSSPNLNLVMGFDMWIVERLLCHPEININPVDDMGETPLMWAVMERHSDAVMTLLKKGANPNIPNNENRTPLHVALSARNPVYGIVIPLLTNGADLYCEDRFRRTPVDELIRNITDAQTLGFASRCVWFIAFRYQIRRSLKRKLKRFPELTNQLDECCKEARLIRRLTIHEKFTLYDFARNCFPERGENCELTICTHLVEILLSELFRKYFGFIFDNISRQALYKVFKSIIGSQSAENLIPNDARKSTIYDAINQFYDENDALKRRLLEVKEFLMKKM